jgi:hypothetical protein
MKNIFKEIIEWVFGISCFLLSFSFLGDSYFSVIMFLFLALLMIPHFYRLIFNKFMRIEIIPKTKWFIFFFGITLIMLVDVFYSQEKKELIQQKVNPERVAEINQVKFFIDNHYKKVQDNEGISYEITFERKEIERIPIFESEKIFNAIYSNYNELNSKVDSTNYVIVGSYNVRYEFILKSNGNVVNKLPFKGVLLKVSEFRQSSNSFIEVFRWCATSYLYFPELDVDQKKEIIFNFTGGSNYCGWGENLNNKIYNLAIEAVRKSGLTI